MVISPGLSKVSFRPVGIPRPATGPASEQPAAELIAWAIEPASDAPIKFYAGPKDLVRLQAIDPALGKVIDFGWFDFIVVPLLRALNWIHGYVGNYGWSIIILTVLINAVMFPLRHKSVVSMRKMQQIQPEAKAIQERYAKLKSTDPARQKMNQELMALYRERGVNPASGCVPMLLTMPVFFAFYAMLTVAIELRGAPFFGWIHDLSRPDPLYIIPDADGSHPDLADAYHPADRHRSGAAEDDDDHAGRLHVLFPVDLGGRPAVLAGEQRVGHRAAVSDELPDRTAEGPHGQAAGRTPDETRWLGQDRCCSARGVKMPDAIATGCRVPDQICHGAGRQDAGGCRGDG